MPHEGWKKLLDHAREKKIEAQPRDKARESGHHFPEVASKAVENTKMMAKNLSDASGIAFDNITEMSTEKRNDLYEQ
jgi:gas vesicle protein